MHFDLYKTERGLYFKANVFKLRAISEIGMKNFDNALLHLEEAIEIFKSPQLGKIGKPHFAVCLHLLASLKRQQFEKTQELKY